MNLVFFLTTLLFTIIPSIIHCSLEFISKTEVTYSLDKCSENPMLNFLPEEMKYQVEITLSSKPKKQSLDFCHINDSLLNCCTSFTYSHIKLFLSDYLYLPKKNIHERNLYYYKQLYDEHKRNFIKGYQIKKEDFESVFSELHNKVKEIIQLSEEIVNESARYNWDAFCNYICHYPAAIEQNCKVYKLLYKLNGADFEDYEYECKVDQERIMNFKDKLNLFINMKTKLNDTMNGYYETIKSTAKNKFHSILMFDLLLKSVDDGNHVAMDINKPFLCAQNETTYILNDYLNNSLVKVDTSCNALIEKPCGIFGCIEDFYMEFFDVTEFNQSYIVKQFNYTKSTLLLSDANDFFSYKHEKDMKGLTDGMLEFAYGFIIQFNLLLCFSAIIILLI